MRMWSITLAAIIASLIIAARAQAAFPGRNGRLAFEVTAWNLSGTQFDNPSSASGKIATLRPGMRPHSLLSCSAGDDAGCQAAIEDVTGPCTDTFGSPCLDGSRPSFSPDGSRIVFGDDPCRQRYCRRITLINADGTGETQLPALTEDDAQPAFLSSGGLVFAGRASRGAGQNLYTVAVDGSGLRQLTMSGASQPAPCANGAIAFIHNDNLYVRSAGGRSRELVRGASWPDCSPNSRQIAFLHDNDLYVIRIAGRRLHRLTHHRIAHSAPAFSPDGRLIALATEHRPSKAWRPAGPRPTCSDKVCIDGIYTNVYVQIVNLRGQERVNPRFLGNDGSDSDGFGWYTAPGGVSWQPAMS